MGMSTTFRLDAETVCEILNQLSPYNHDFAPSELSDEVIEVFSKDYEEGGAMYAVSEFLGCDY